MQRYNLRKAENEGVSRIPSPPTIRENVKLGSHDFSSEPSRKKSKTSATLFSLPPEMILHIGKYLDSRSMLALYRTCRWFKELQDRNDTFWKMICIKEELNNRDCLRMEEDLDKIGFVGKPMHISTDKITKWRKIYLRGLQMRRNIIESNFEGWRLFANHQVPIIKMNHNQDLLKLKKLMGDVPKLSANDDLKIDWDEKYLVIFHIFRSQGESSKIWVFDIENEPKFLYMEAKGSDYVTDKIFVHKGHVVTVPSWPISAGAVISTFSIDDNMNVVGKFMFGNQERQTQIDQLWMHTVLRVVKDADQALVVCRSPQWECLVVALPSCNLLKTLRLYDVTLSYHCLQIRAYGSTAILVFTNDHQEGTNILVTVDVAGETSKRRSFHNAIDVLDVALCRGHDKIYLLKKNGDIFHYDAEMSEEEVIISNNLHQPLDPAMPHATSEYQMFVNPNEAICLLQSSTEVETGRFVKVFSFNGDEQYHINLDKWQHGLTRDESLCIYTTRSFLAVANSQKILLFHVKTGEYAGSITIPNHMERAIGKEDSACMFEPVGLNLIFFDEDKLIAVHDYERKFPSVVDIYKFW